MRRGAGGRGDECRDGTAVEAFRWRRAQRPAGPSAARNHRCPETFSAIQACPRQSMVLSIGTAGVWEPARQLRQPSPRPPHEAAPPRCTGAAGRFRQRPLRPSGRSDGGLLHTLCLPYVMTPCGVIEKSELREIPGCSSTTWKIPLERRRTALQFGSTPCRFASVGSRRDRAFTTRNRATRAARPSSFCSWPDSWFSFSRVLPLLPGHYRVPRHRPTSDSATRIAPNPAMRFRIWRPMSSPSSMRSPSNTPRSWATHFSAASSRVVSATHDQSHHPPGAHRHRLHGIQSGHAGIAGIPAPASKSDPGSLARVSRRAPPIGRCRRNFSSVLSRRV